MERPVAARRPLLLILWLGLLLAGCMAQFGMLPTPQSGDEPVVTRVIKPQVHGNGAWERLADGSTRLAVNLAPLRPDPVPGRFRTQYVALSTITGIQAVITAADIAQPIVPVGATANGSLAVTNGIIPPLTFPSVPAGKQRNLEITGYDASGQSVAGAFIATVFDNTGSTGSFEVSPRTTPAYRTLLSLKSLNASVAAAIDTAALHAFVDQVTGVTVGSTYPHTYAAHPALVNHTGIAQSLYANGGTLAPLDPSGYRMPGGKVDFSFYLPYDGSPGANDKVTVWASDPISQPFELPHHVAGTGTLAVINTASLAVTIHDDNLVTVTFGSLAAGPVKVGATVPGDNTASPNPRYFHTEVSPGIYTAGHDGTATISPTDAANGSTAFPNFTVPAVDAKWVANQVRTRKVPTGPAQNFNALLDNAISDLAGSGSPDMRVYVGPVIGAGSPYNLTSVTLTATDPIEIVGPPGTATTARPVLMGIGQKLTFTSTAHRLADVRLSGVSVAISGGGTLHNVTIEGVRGSSGTVAGVLATSGFASLDGVSVFDVRHMASPPAPTDVVAGIALSGTASGSINQCRVDDNGGVGETKSVRFEFPGNGQAVGFGANTSGNVAIQNSTAVRIGYTNGAPGTWPAVAAGIQTGGSGPQVVTGCTVANVYGNSTISGIAVENGTIANCEVHQLMSPSLTAVKALHIGDGNPSGNLTCANNRVHNVNATAAGATVAAIVGTPAPGAQLTIQGNKVENCQGFEFYGVRLDNGQNAGTETVSVTANVITGCSNSAANMTQFRGIATGTNTTWAALAVNDNDISQNTLRTNGRGIATAFSTGTVSIQHNRFDGNTLAEAGTSGSCVWAAIQTMDSGTPAVTIRDNLITGNQAAMGMSLTCTLAAIDYYGPSSTPTLRNNLITGNTVTLQSSGQTLEWLKVMASTATVVSNRIYSNTHNGDGIAGSSLHGIIAGQGTIATNLVSLVGLGIGQGAFHQTIYTIHAAGTADLQHNSLYMTQRVGSAPVAGANSGEMILRDNVIYSGTGTSPAVSTTSGPLTTLGFNTFYPFGSSDMFAVNGTPISPHGDDRQAPAAAFSDLNLLTLSPAEAAIPNSSGTGERGFYGGNPDAAPTWP